MLSPLLLVPGSVNNLGNITVCHREVRHVGVKVVIDTSVSLVSENKSGGHVLIVGTLSLEIIR